MSFVNKNLTWILFGGVLILWFAVPFITAQLAPTFDDRGPYGDQFGSVTALFSGLAFAGLILTLIYQSKALDLQRDALLGQQEELKLTRESVEKQTEELGVSSKALQEQIKEMSAQKVEMEAMKEAQQAQVNYMARQAYENSFFQLLKLWNDHIESFGGRSELSKVIGKTCVNVGGLKPHVMLMLGEAPSLDDRYTVSEQEAYFRKAFGDKREYVLRPYILLLLHIMRHVSESDSGIVEKKKYAQIIRANLSSSEKKFLFFNCAFQHQKVLKPLLEEFALLANIDPVILEKNPHFKEEYNSKAFR